MENDFTMMGVSADEYSRMKHHKTTYRRAAGRGLGEDGLKPGYKRKTISADRKVSRSVPPVAVPGIFVGLRLPHLPTAATRSAPFFRHRRRSHRSPQAGSLLTFLPKQESYPPEASFVFRLPRVLMHPRNDNERWFCGRMWASAPTV